MRLAVYNSSAGLRNIHHLLSTIDYSTPQLALLGTFH